MKQHRVSETYWNQFSFLINSEFKKLSVLEKGKGFTSSQTVKSFTREENIFNVLGVNDELILENTFRDIENKYPQIIDKINSRSTLSSGEDCFLLYFLASLICRNKQNIELFTHLMNVDKQGFINEITCLLDEPILKKGLIDETEINVILGLVMIHFAAVLNTFFSSVILVAAKNKYWLTTNNPVVWDNNDDFSYLITPNSEFYLPLNSECCLYIYHANSAVDNPIRRSLPEGLFYHACNDDEHDFVMDKVSNNEFEYLVCPVNLGRVDLLK